MFNIGDEVAGLQQAVQGGRPLLTVTPWLPRCSAAALGEGKAALQTAHAAPCSSTGGGTPCTSCSSLTTVSMKPSKMTSPTEVTTALEAP